MISSDRSDVSQSKPRPDLMEDARPDSDSPSRIEDFFEGLERFNSSNDFRWSLRTPTIHRQRMWEIP